MNKVNSRGELNGNVRLVKEDGTPRLINAGEAYDLANNQGLDLVIVSDDKTSPVVKILDYGKHIYNSKKKKKQSKVKTHLKEIKFHVNIAEHDFSIKVNHILKFLEKKHNVKVTIALRGREMAHRQVARELIDKVIAQSDDKGKPEKRPVFQGRNISTILLPK